MAKSKGREESEKNKYYAGFFWENTKDWHQINLFQSSLTCVCGHVCLWRPWPLPAFSYIFIILLCLEASGCWPVSGGVPPPTDNIASSGHSNQVVSLLCSQSVIKSFRSVFLFDRGRGELHRHRQAGQRGTQQTQWSVHSHKIFSIVLRCSGVSLYFIM